MVEVVLAVICCISEFPVAARYDARTHTHTPHTHTQEIAAATAWKHSRAGAFNLATPVFPQVSSHISQASALLDTLLNVSVLPRESYLEGCLTPWK